MRMHVLLHMQHTASMHYALFGQLHCGELMHKMLHAFGCRCLHAQGRMPPTVCSVLQRPSASRACIDIIGELMTAMLEYH